MHYQHAFEINALCHPSHINFLTMHSAALQWQPRCSLHDAQVNQSKGEAGMLETRKAYEYALDRIGLDLHAAGLWHEYINYLQLPRPNTPAYRALWTSTAGPGQEDSQRVMTLRWSLCTCVVANLPCRKLPQSAQAIILS